MSDRPKWTYADFFREITDLKQRVTSLEIGLKDAELDCAQYRITLCGLMSAIEKGLTKNPFPWDKESQKIWDEAARKIGK